MSVTDANVQLNDNTIDHRGQSPNGKWTLEVTRRPEALDFARSRKQVCVRIFLGCP
jgi:hypothetical protein